MSDRECFKPRRTLRPGTYMVRMDSVRMDPMRRDSAIVEATIMGGSGHEEDQQPHAEGEKVTFKLPFPTVAPSPMEVCEHKSTVMGSTPAESVCVLCGKTINRSAR